MKKSKTKSKYRYFKDQKRSDRIIVFTNNNPLGRSYWSDGVIGDPNWTIEDMSLHFISYEITRAQARKIIKHIP